MMSGSCIGGVIGTQVLTGFQRSEYLREKNRLTNDESLSDVGHEIRLNEEIIPLFGGHGMN